MEIRKLMPDDAEAYLALRIEALEKNPEAFGATLEEAKAVTAEKYRERFKSTVSVTFGAFDGDQLVGNATLAKERLTKMAHRGFLTAMYITPQARGTGMAARLVEAVCKQAAKEAIEQIHLTVVANNVAAKKLYSRCGFTVYGIDKKAIKHNGEYLDEELMVKFL